MTENKNILKKDFEFIFIGDKIEIELPKHLYIEAYIKRILKELVNASIEQWLLGALTDPSYQLDEMILSVTEQLDKLKKEATYKILEMFEIKNINEDNKPSIYPSKRK